MSIKIRSAKNPYNNVRNPFSNLIKKYNARAVECRQSRDLRGELLNLKIVSSFLPYDEGIKKRMTDIKEKISNTANQHFRKGLSYYQNGLIESARAEFLLTLAYNPDHEAVLYYLKQILHGEDYIYYKIREGDTLESIAEKVYNDRQKRFLISYFNEFDHIKPATILKLPVLDHEHRKRSIDDAVSDIKVESHNKVEPHKTDIGKMLVKAKDLLNAKKYQEAISIFEQSLKYDPFNNDVQDMINTSYYEWGKILIIKEKYLESLKVLNHIDHNYKDVNQTIAFLEKRLRNDAETHYLKGVNNFLNEEFDEAIKEWEIALTLNQNHSKAKRDIKNAYSLLKKLKAIQ